MLSGCLDGMTRAEAWRNEYQIRRLAAIEPDHHDGAGSDRLRQARPDNEAARPAVSNLRAPENSANDSSHDEEC
jgi:hypothetical protein